MNKVLAAAGAAATSAVLGSLFGVAGTVLGAAVGAVASTVAASLYQRSLERARTAVVSHVAPRITGRLRQGETAAVDPEATVVMPPLAVAEDPRTVLIAPQVPHRSRGRVIGYVVATVLGFALALGGVTGIEAIKGSTLVTGQAGTSVGRVLVGSPRTATPAPMTDGSDGGDPDGSGDPTDSNDPAPNGSGNTGNTGDNDHHRNDDDGSGSPSATRTPSPSSSRTPSPTPSPSPSPSGAGATGGLGAAPTGADQ